VNKTGGDYLNDAPITAYITNLGKYNEGALVGEWLELPTTTEKVQDCLKRIGIDGIRYEEIFITDYETNVNGLHDCLPEYASIDELNYLAALIDELPQHEADKLEAVLDFGEHTGSPKDLINLVQNLDCYDLYPNVTNEREYGEFLIDECGTMEIPENLLRYFDYEAYGRDCSLNESSLFTDTGYVLDTGDSFTEHYAGREDIPEEYQVFAYPKPNFVQSNEKAGKTHERAGAPVPVR